MNYMDFLKSKAQQVKPAGLKIGKMNKRMRGDQKLVTERALATGRYCIFADCGLGKTIDELEWASQVAKQAGQVLILAPLCVGIQTQQMAKTFGYDVNLCRDQSDVKDGINITNYERLDKFDASAFSGVVLDESSILKNYSGKIRNAIIDQFRATPYKLACTATPAPNDFMELGNHSEFLGVMTRAEMLSMYFIHDGGETQTWRLKGHATGAFWDWVAQWSTTYRKPSELGKFSDDGFELPQLHIHKHVVEILADAAGMLFAMPAEDLSEQRKIKRISLDKRLDKVVEIVNGVDGHCVVWCDLNDEADSLEDMMDDCRQISGSMSIEEKEEILLAFTNGQIKRLITKQKITSFGLNWQHCANTVFAGVNYSYEQAYQAIKRFHRFGQKSPVHAHWVMADLEYNVFSALTAKMNNHDQMREVLSCAM